MASTTKKYIPLSIPLIRGNEWKYIKDCLDTGWVSSVGSYVGRFERKVAEYAGSKYAVACSSGTAALHLALLVAGVKPGEEVIVPALTFIAPANTVRYVGAEPVFIDVEFDYRQIDIQKLKDFLTKECVFRNGKLVNKKSKRRVRAIIAVHLLGHPVDMKSLNALARRFGLVVIEDAAESIGAKCEGRQTGSLGDVGCFSFNGNKIITTGGGGMLVTNNRVWAERARYLSTQAKEDEGEYIHHEVGYNYRLTNIQAALGLAQMECLDDYIARKRRIAKVYQKKLQGIPGLSLPQEAPWALSTWWLYTVVVDKAFGMDSRELLKALHTGGIQSRPLWHPLNRLKPFRKCFAYKIEVADTLYRQALSLPSSVDLKPADQQRVITFIRQRGTR